MISMIGHSPIQWGESRDGAGIHSLNESPYMTHTREGPTLRAYWNRRRTGRRRGRRDRPPPPTSLFRGPLVSLTRGAGRKYRATIEAAAFYDMEDQTVTLTSNGYGAQVYLPRTVFRHSRTVLEPGDEVVLEVLADGRIALAPTDGHDSPVDGRRRETTGDDGNTTGVDGSSTGGEV